MGKEALAGAGLGVGQGANKHFDGRETVCRAAIGAAE